MSEPMSIESNLRRWGRLVAAFGDVEDALALQAVAEHIESLEADKAAGAIAQGEETVPLAALVAEHRDRAVDARVHEHPLARLCPEAVGDDYACARPFGHDGEHTDNYDPNEWAVQV